MKKLLVILILGFISACTPDILDPIDLNVVDVPESLKIDDISGLKTESTIVSNEVRINAKLPYTGTYRIKIRDIENEMISQEKLNAEEGDNLLKVYVSTLPKSSYTIELAEDNHTIIGRGVIVVQ